MEENSDPYSLFLCALNGPVSRERYTTMIGWFFSNIGIPGLIEERRRAYVERGTRDSGWV